MYTIDVFFFSVRSTTAGNESTSIHICGKGFVCTLILRPWLLPQQQNLNELLSQAHPVVTSATWESSLHFKLSGVAKERKKKKDDAALQKKTQYPRCITGRILILKIPRE